jgi:hypothetical protein
MSLTNAAKFSGIRTVGAGLTRPGTLTADGGTLTATVGLGFGMEREGSFFSRPYKTRR